jgi:hypothetical protein
MNTASCELLDGMLWAGRLPWSEFAFFSQCNVLAEGNVCCVNVKFCGFPSLIKLLFPPRMNFKSEYFRLFVWQRIVSTMSSV